MFVKTPLKLIFWIEVSRDREESNNISEAISGGTRGELYEKFSFNISPFGKGGLRGIL